MLVVLWTDALMFLLFAGIVLSAWYISRKDHLRRPWGYVMQSKVGVVSLVVLGFFLIIGLADSIHYRQQLPPAVQQNAQQTIKKIQYSSQVLSVFDAWVTPLRTRSEKTYSAPFASVAYAKEMQTDAAGNVQWGFPRLKYGGAHLEKPDQDSTTDVIKKTAIGGFKGLAVCLLLIISFRVVGRKNKTSATTRYSTAAVFCILVLGFAVAELSRFYHVLGTDKVGEDVLYQALKSIRTGLVIGSLTTLVMLPIAISLGLLAGFFRGWVDDVIQYIYTTLSSIPGVLLIAAAILMAQVYMANNPDLFAGVERRADMRLLFLCLILGVTSWTGLCRLLRAETLKIREMDYVMAAKAMGVGNFTLLKRHILPNVFHLVMITVVLDFSGLVLAEAVLSYVNIGVDPATYSWGNMINSARLEMAREPIVWWSLSAAFIFMLALVLAANLFADVVRDAFDPRTSR